jgi:hypothetical protein
MGDQEKVMNMGILGFSANAGCEKKKATAGIVFQWLWRFIR